jgi:hypothetical protein
LDELSHPRAFFFLSTQVFSTTSQGKVTFHVTTTVASRGVAGAAGGAGRGIPPPVPPNKPQILPKKDNLMGAGRAVNSAAAALGGSPGTVKPGGDVTVLDRGQPISFEVNPQKQQALKFGITISKDKIHITNAHHQHQGASSSSDGKGGEAGGQQQVNGACLPVPVPVPVDLPSLSSSPAPVTTKRSSSVPPPPPPPPAPNPTLNATSTLSLSSPLSLSLDRTHAQPSSPSSLDLDLLGSALDDFHELLSSMAPSRGDFPCFRQSSPFYTFSLVGVSDLLWHCPIVFETTVRRIQIRSDDQIPKLWSQLAIKG